MFVLQEITNVRFYKYIVIQSVIKSSKHLFDTIYFL